MRFDHLRTASVVMLAIGLAACGGGSSSGGGSGAPSTSSPPAPAPTPPPPPPSAPPPPVSSSSFRETLAALTADQDFAATGFVYRSNYVAASDTMVGSVPDGVGSIGLRYLVSSRQFSLSLPDFPAGRLIAKMTGGDGYTHYDLFDLEGSPGIRVALRTPGPNDANFTTSFRYSGIGVWSSLLDYRSGPSNEGVFAFGLPTPAAAVPATGERFFVSVLHASETNYFKYSQAGAEGDRFRGSAQLSFNLATRAFEGSLRPTVIDHWYGETPLGEFRVVQTSFPQSGTIFSGRLTVPGSSELGWFEGRFTGPEASEFILRWQAPYFNPQSETWGHLFGVSVGRTGS